MVWGHHPSSAVLRELCLVADEQQTRLNNIGVFVRKPNTPTNTYLETEDDFACHLADKVSAYYPDLDLIPTLTDDEELTAGDVAIVLEEELGYLCELVALKVNDERGL